MDGFEDKIHEEAIIRAAAIAKNWLEDWGMDLQETSDAYRSACISGTVNGRRIPKEMAKVYARDFRERADAVYDCGALVEKAILDLL